MIQTRSGRPRDAEKPSNRAESAGSGSAFGFRPLNLGLLVAGLAAVAVGYVLLGGGSTIAAPLLLVFGYAACIPAGLLVGLGDGRGRDADRGE